MVAYSCHFVFSCGTWDCLRRCLLNDRVAFFLEHPFRDRERFVALFRMFGEEMLDRDRGFGESLFAAVSSCFYERRIPRFIADALILPQRIQLHALDNFLEWVRR